MNDLELAARRVFISGGAFTPRAAEDLAAAGNQKIDTPIDAASLKTRVTELVAVARRTHAGRTAGSTG
ncbi:MAG: hypothetical protein ABIJ09_14680 [Pseudomonadota bacterium]